MGLSPQHKGHKCLAPSGRIYISKDVLFNENLFPYPNLFSTTSNSSPPLSTYPASIPIPQYPPLQVTPLNQHSPPHSPGSLFCLLSTPIMSMQSLLPLPILLRNLLFLLLCLSHLSPQSLLSIPLFSPLQLILSLHLLLGLHLSPLVSLSSPHLLPHPSLTLLHPPTLTPC